MTVTRIDSNARMSQAVVHGGIAYLAGQVATGDTIEVQTQGVLDAIDALLARVGSGKSKLLSATIWLADMADFGAMNAVWEKWIDPANPPARATGEVKLATPAYRVEIIVNAVV
jgi:enamine deaminase RidA (YjgF/YER057c/UK114 family)